MPVTRNAVDRSKFNKDAILPFELRHDDFEMAMQDVYDFFFDVNRGLVERGFNASTTCCAPLSCPGYCRIC